MVWPSQLTVFPGVDVTRMSHTRSIPVPSGGYRRASFQILDKAVGPILGSFCAISIALGKKGKEDENWQGDKNPSKPTISRKCFRCDAAMGNCGSGKLRCRPPVQAVNANADRETNHRPALCLRRGNNADLANRKFDMRESAPFMSALRGLRDRARHLMRPRHVTAPLFRTRLQQQGGQPAPAGLM
jgi:hypothetical protein